MSAIELSQIDELNSLFPVGSEVIYTDDFGGKEEVKTRSIVWDLCGTPVVKLEGKTGGYDMGRVVRKEL